MSGSDTIAATAVSVFPAIPNDLVAAPTFSWIVPITPLGRDHFSSVIRSSMPVDPAREATPLLGFINTQASLGEVMPSRCSKVVQSPLTASGTNCSSAETGLIQIAAVPNTTNGSLKVIRICQWQPQSGLSLNRETLGQRKATRKTTSYLQDIASIAAERGAFLPAPVTTSKAHERSRHNQKGSKDLSLAGSRGRAPGLEPCLTR